MITNYDSRVVITEILLHYDSRDVTYDRGVFIMDDHRLFIILATGQRIFGKTTAIGQLSTNLST